MSSRRLIVALFVVVIVGTTAPAVAHEPLEPEDYQWVTVPDGLDAGSESPDRVEITYAPVLFEGGRAYVWTADLQASLELAVASPPSLPVAAWIVPVDPSIAAPTVDSPNGNGHRVVVEGAHVDAVRLRLRLPYPADGARSAAGAPLAATSHGAGELVVDLGAAPLDVVVVATRDPPASAPLENGLVRKMLVAPVVALAAIALAGRRRGRG